MGRLQTAVSVFLLVLIAFMCFAQFYIAMSMKSACIELEEIRHQLIKQRTALWKERKQLTAIKQELRKLKELKLQELRYEYPYKIWLEPLP